MLAVRGGIKQTFKELEFVTNLLLAGTIIFVSPLFACSPVSPSINSCVITLSGWRTSSHPAPTRIRCRTWLRFPSRFPPRIRHPTSMSRSSLLFHRIPRSSRHVQLDSFKYRRSDFGSDRDFLAVSLLSTLGPT